MSNRPESLREVLRLTTAIAVVCEKELFPGADTMNTGATKIAADVFLCLKEGLKAEVVKDFNDMIVPVSGKRFITKLVNFCVQDIPVKSRGLVQEAKNEISSTVEMLNTFWKPARVPTFDQTVAEIERMSEGKGLIELHRRWMKHLSDEARSDKKSTADLVEEGKRSLLEKEAQKKGLTLLEYKAELLALEDEQKSAEGKAAWNELVRNGTVIQLSGRLDWLVTGAVFVEHDGQLVRLSDEDGERARDCLMGH